VVERWWKSRTVLLEKNSCPRKSKNVTLGSTRTMGSFNVNRIFRSKFSEEFGQDQQAGDNFQGDKLEIGQDQRVIQGSVPIQLMASLNSGMAEGHSPDLGGFTGDICQGDKVGRTWWSRMIKVGRMFQK
jgi:hypothetical protein